MSTAPCPFISVGPAVPACPPAICAVSARSPAPFADACGSPVSPGPAAADAGAPISDDTNAVCSTLTGSFSCLTRAGLSSVSSVSSGGAFEATTVPVTFISFSTACTSFSIFL